MGSDHGCSRHMNPDKISDITTLQAKENVTNLLNSLVLHKNGRLISCWTVTLRAPSWFRSPPGGLSIYSNGVFGAPVMLQLNWEPGLSQQDVSHWGDMSQASCDFNFVSVRDFCLWSVKAGSVRGDDECVWLSVGCCSWFWLLRLEWALWPGVTEGTIQHGRIPGCSFNKFNKWTCSDPFKFTAFTLHSFCML